MVLLIYEGMIKQKYYHYKIISVQETFLTIETLTYME